MKNTDVRIGTYTYKGCKSVTLNLSASTTQAALEEGVYVDFHITNDPVAFELDITFYEDVTNPNYQSSDEAYPIGGNYSAKGVFNRVEQYNYLAWLWDNKMMFKFVCDLGSFENMIVTGLSTKESSASKSSFEATLSIKQLNVVSFEAATFQYIVDSDGKVIGLTPVGDYDKVTLIKPSSSSKNKDWWESAYDWLANRPLVKGWNEYWK
jgi:hypothetical protein